MDKNYLNLKINFTVNFYCFLIRYKYYFKDTET